MNEFWYPDEDSWLGKFCDKIKDWWYPMGEYLYWIRCRFWHRYNVVYIKTLTPTWHDRDDVMEHAMFQILVDFIEKEEPGWWKQTHAEVAEAYTAGFFDSDYGEAVATECDDLRMLYNYWKYELPAQQEALSKELEEAFKDIPVEDFFARINDGTLPDTSAIHAKEDAYTKQLDLNLQKLLSMRRLLWT